MTREETETVIVFNSEDDLAVVDTMHPWVKRACEEVIRRMGRGRERHRDHGTRDGRKVRWEFEIPVEAIRAPMAPTKREITPEQKRALIGRGKANLARIRAQRMLAEDPDGGRTIHGVGERGGRENASDDSGVVGSDVPEDGPEAA